MTIFSVMIGFCFTNNALIIYSDDHINVIKCLFDFLCQMKCLFVTIMHQSYATKAPLGPGVAGA